ncbi:hypothetical protein ACTMU2_32285 [Cupriavidus basilensis]
MSHFLDIRRDGPVAIVTMNRPETRNAVSDDDAVDAPSSPACDAFNRDRSVRRGIDSGAGTAFPPAATSEDPCAPSSAANPASRDGALRPTAKASSACRWRWPTWKCR